MTCNREVSPLPLKRGRLLTRPMVTDVVTLGDSSTLSPVRRKNYLSLCLCIEKMVTLRWLPELSPTVTIAGGGMRHRRPAHSDLPQKFGDRTGTVACKPLIAQILQRRSGLGNRGSTSEEP